MKNSNIQGRIILMIVFFTMLFTSVTTPPSVSTPEAFSAPEAVAGVQLHLQGSTLVRPNGQRFVVSGVNVELYRDYFNDCGWVTDGQIAIQDVWVTRIQSLGINAVRLNYNRNTLGDATRLVNFLTFAQALASKGIYVMPSDHVITGGRVSNGAASNAIIKKIVDDARAKGWEEYLILNPWNEPGPDDSWPQWTSAMKTELDFIRTNMAFKGVVFFDGKSWAADFDRSSFLAVMAYDATLLGGTSNVGFSNHWYPNISIGSVDAAYSQANSIPLIIGELGQENPGSSPLDPNYVKSVISKFFATGMINGHNGLFAWILGWCDTNKMIEDWTDPSVPYTKDSPLSPHGQLWVTNYYSKLSSPDQQPTVVAPTRTPLTPTVTRTATPQPSITPTPRRTSTPVRTTIPTSTPVPTALCAVGQVEVEVKFNGQTIVLCGYVR